MSEYAQRICQSITGYWDYPRAMAFREIARSLPDGSRIMDVGGFHGMSGLSIADICLEKGCHIDVVCPFEKHIESYAANAKKFRVAECVSFHHCISRFFFRIAKAKSTEYSLVFLDGSLREQDLTCDVLDAIDVLIDSGVLCGNDYGNPGRDKVQAIVDHFFPTAEKAGWFWHIASPRTAARPWP